jgi:hypothetical protein
MEEVIIVAGEDKAKVCRLRRRLREHGYNSVPCRSAEQIVYEMDILPTCDACVPLVVVAPAILRDADDDLIARLSDCAPNVPILLFDRTNVPDDLAEAFAKICEYRTQFRREQNPTLAKVLNDAGVEMACS